jgi:hypothetical protein
MHAPNDNTAPRGLRGWWASPPRSGMRRIIAPWEYRHLRFFARVRIGGGIVATGLGIVTLAFGGSDWATYGWMLFFLAVAAANFSAAYWLLTIARSESSQS